MNKTICSLLFCLSVARLASAGEASDPSARDYNLSMAGALISDWCERNWQSSEYVSVHACNYQLAQLYNLEVSSEDFGECTVVAGGDIVQIADCMVARFDVWLVEEGLEKTTGEPQ